VLQRVDALRWAPGIDFTVSDAQLEKLVAQPTPEVRWIKRGDRALVGEVVVRAFNAASTGGEGAVRVLLALPRLILGNRHLVKQRCKGLLQGGEVAKAVVEEVVNEERKPGGNGKDFDPLDKAVQLAKMGQAVEALRVAFAAGAEDLDGASSEKSGSTTSAKSNQELVESMLPVDRGGPVDADELERVKKLESVEGKNVSLDRINWDTVLRELKPGRAAGLDGWRNEHLISLLGAGREVAGRLREAVGKFAKMVYSGTMDINARPWFAAARVVFIPKADGSPRPLGVVGTLRRMIARAVVRKLVPHLTPWLVRRGQMGVGAPAGTEALARTAQRAFENGKAVLALDRKNAYPSMRPELAVATLRAKLPSMRGLLETLLKEPAKVRGDGVRSTFLGFLMGCPASPVGYATGVEAGIDTVRTDLVTLEVESKGFLDDGTLAAEGARELQEAYNKIEQAGAVWGQVLHPAKCKLLVKADRMAAFAGVLPDIPRVQSMKLVGVPVGEDAAREEACVAMVAKATATRRRLAKRLPKQAAYYTLRKSDGLPALVHMIRGLPPSLTARAAEAHDKAVEEEVAHFAGTVPAGLGELRPTVCLPLRLGGRAVASAVLTAPPAYVAATVQVNRIVKSVGGPLTSDSAAAFQLVRESGRPAQWWGDGPKGICGGPAKCRMEKQEGCAKGCCAVCCAVQGACTRCAELVRGLRAELEVRELLGDRWVPDAIDRAAAVTGVSRKRVEDAFVAASRYAAPQRAMTCALLGERYNKLKQHLERTGQVRARRMWTDNKQPEAYALWLASPLAVPLSDAVFLVGMRQALGLAVMAPTALRCKTKGGYEGKTCPVKGIRPMDFAARAAADPWAAEDHALKCKCGGCAIHTHDGVVNAVEQVGAEWDVHVQVEQHKGLTGGKRMDVVIPVAGDPGSHGLAVDWTRRVEQQETGLALAEKGKVEKYTAAYENPMTIVGAAFNERGRLGPGARQAVDRMVWAGVSATGSHPDDLRLELLARIGAAVLFGNAATFAHFANLNRDAKGGFAPRPGTLKPSGMRRVMGVAQQLTAPGKPGKRGRGRPRGSKNKKKEEKKSASGGVVACEVPPGTSCGVAVEGAVVVCGSESVEAVMAESTELMNPDNLARVGACSARATRAD
jgi:hypothetical protein